MSERYIETTKYRCQDTLGSWLIAGELLDKYGELENTDEKRNKLQRWISSKNRGVMSNAEFEKGEIIDVPDGPANIKKAISIPVEPVKNGTIYLNSNSSAITIKSIDGVDPCRIIAINKSVELKGVPTEEGGTYRWSTTSKNIELENSNSQTVTIKPEKVSLGVDKEELTLHYTTPGGKALPEKKIKLTVISVGFSEIRHMKYGYDDMDNNPGDKSYDPDTLHHVSVKQEDYTLVRVKIRGGLTGDQLTFTSADTTIANVQVPENAGRDFNLLINGKDKTKAETKIEARIDSQDVDSCAEIVVNVYEEVEHEINIYRIEDPNVSNSSLNGTVRSMVVENAVNAANEWVKRAVVTLTFKDKSEGVKSISYNPTPRGELTLGNTKDAKAMLEAIEAGLDIDSFNSNDLIIVNRARWPFSLTNTSVKKGSREIVIHRRHTYHYFTAGNSYNLVSKTIIDQKEVNREENVEIIKAMGNRLTLKNGLKYSHTNAELDFPLAGLSGSPMFLVSENLDNPNTLLEVIVHECGHNFLKWSDVNAPGNIMHHQASYGPSNEVRMKELPLYYREGEVQKQWEIIDRS